MVLMMGRWTSPLQTLYITPRREVYLRCSKASHPSESSMRCTLKVLWHRFSTNRAARLWTASSLSALFWAYGSHTDEAYSSTGLAKALYALSFMALELIFRLRHRKPSVLLALFTTLLWLSQSIFCCMVMPEYLTLETESRVWPRSSHEQSRGLLLLVIGRNTHLAGWNHMFRLSSHSTRRWLSC